MPANEKVIPFPLRETPESVSSDLADLPLQTVPDHILEMEACVYLHGGYNRLMPFAAFLYLCQHLGRLSYGET